MMTIIAAIACGQAMNSARTSVAAVAKKTTPTTARVETPLATPIVSATSEPATIATESSNVTYLLLRGSQRSRRTSRRVVNLGLPFAPSRRIGSAVKRPGPDVLEQEGQADGSHHHSEENDDRHGLRTPLKDLRRLWAHQLLHDHTIGRRNLVGQLLRAHVSPESVSTSLGQITRCQWKMSRSQSSRSAGAESGFRPRQLDRQ